MLFNLINFIVYFPVVVLLYFAVPGKIRYKWLLLASYYFYMCWNDALHIIKSILTVHNPWIFLDDSIYKLGLSEKQFHLLIFSLAILLIADWLKYKKINILDEVLEQELWCRWSVYITGILFVLIFGIWGNAYDAQASVYFQF